MSNTQRPEPLFPCRQLFLSRLLFFSLDELVDRFLPILDRVLPWMSQFTRQHALDDFVSGIQKAMHWQPDGIDRMCPAVVLDHEQVVGVCLATRGLNVDSCQLMSRLFQFIKPKCAH